METSNVVPFAPRPLEFTSDDLAAATSSSAMTSTAETDINVHCSRLRAFGPEPSAKSAPRVRWTAADVRLFAGLFLSFGAALLMGVVLGSLR